MNLPPIPDSWILILILCLSRIAMNSSPTYQRAEDGHPPNHNRFFFQPLPAPHVFVPPVSHFMHPAAFHPHFYPTVDFGGSLYYPVCPMPFPRSYGPRSPMAHTNFRRPYFNSFVARPTFYHSTRFRHYPFRRNVTNTEVQTDTSETNPVQPKRTDVVTETMACSSQAAEIRHQKPLGTESASGSADILQERGLHKGLQGESNETEESNAAVASKSAKAGGYALQKEKIRIECSEGAPSINVWRSFEATVPIYNTPNKKVEDGIQCEVWSVSACESGVPFYGSFEADKIIRKTEVPEQCPLPAMSQGMLLDSNKCPETGFESRTKDEVSCCTTMVDKVDNLLCKTNKSRKFPTNEFVHEAPEKPPLHMSSSGLVRQNGMEEKDATNKENEQIISKEPLNEEKMCEALKSDVSLESAEEYIPSASVLAWLQDQAQSSLRKNGLPQTVQHQPRDLDGSFEEISSKDEESSFDFFDVMHGKNQVSYSHLMCNPHSPSFCPATSVCNDEIGSKTLGNQHYAEREQFCSCCKKELLKGKGIKHICRNNSAIWNISSDALSEREDLKKDQLTHGISVSSGRRRCRRISRESFRSNRNKKSRYSSDSIEVSEENDDDSRAGIPEKAKADGFSHKKIIRRSPKISTLQISNRLQQEKLRVKKRSDMAKYIINQREQTKVVSEHQELQKPGQISRLERKHEGKRRKCTRKTMSVQNAGEDSVDEYWNKVGAKPKSATQSLDVEYEKLQQVKPSYKSVPQKRAAQKLNEMDFWDLSDLHGFQGNALRRGRTRSAKRVAPLCHVNKHHLDAIQKYSNYLKYLHDAE
ncbi:uncharacterized protein LOC127574423 [Pristis pectinata]|uniref:uncharacterized protein LOC127574423 n=1 Tax=Pristis pectinata TaxID=685728 RepID=UPI00223DF1D2|nr:uncharacterized protein LOC127574423 [Pristis pectinata]XP_051879388.1 uncharacterized protein LOC127574423 [Pristis pectinata]